MGFLSGIGRGLRGVLDGAAGTQALIAGDYSAYAQLRDRQMRLRSAAAEAEDARRQDLFNQLVEQGLNPAQAELALINPDFARRLLPGFGSLKPAPGEPFGVPDRVAIEHERAHPFFPRELGGDGFGPDGFPGDVSQPRPLPHGIDVDGLELPPDVDPSPLHLGRSVSPIPAVATWHDEPDRYGDEYHLAAQDGFDRGLDIRAAQERARNRKGLARRAAGDARQTRADAQ